MDDINKLSGIEKMQAYRASLTQDQKDAQLSLAKAGREAKRIERAANVHLLKTDYLDATHWAALGSKYNIRMPRQDEKASIKTIRKYLKRAGLTSDSWNEHYTSAEYFVENNPMFTAYAVAGLVLEMRDDSE